MAVRLPPRQKFTLVFLFGLGIFVIVAAILTKVYCLVPELISYVYMSWYFREATVAMLVTCLPLTWSLMRDIFPSLKSWTGGSRPTRPTPLTFSKRTGSRHMDLNTNNYHMQSFSKFKSTIDERDDDFGHETMITRAGSSDGRSASRSTNRSQDYEAPRSREGDTEPLKGNQIRQDVTITVQTEEGRESRGSNEPGHAQLQQNQPRHVRNGSSQGTTARVGSPWTTQSPWPDPLFDPEQQRHYP